MERGPVTYALTAGMVSAGEVDGVLRRHVLDAWFPRCVDRAHGGFLCNFDRRWRPDGAQDKLLEFQARQTLTAADASRLYPNEPKFREAAEHGFRYLREALWDREYGGWLHRLDRKGKVLEGSTKHAHGFAYAIEACAAVYQATGDGAALALARDAFEWLERHCHDEEHGGYFGPTLRDGTVIRDPAALPWKADVDVVDTPIGLKDINVHSDLLETLILLHQVCPDPRVETRVAELVEILTERMMAPNGALHFFVSPDWKPLPHLVRTGYQFQTAFRLLTARDVLGGAPRLVELARLMTAHSLRYAWDRERGGFLYATPATTPLELNGESMRLRYKSWWPQSEALRVLLALSGESPETSAYRDRFDAQWRYVLRRCVDERYDGFYTGATDSAGRWRRRLGARVMPASATRKGSEWKDASHDGRALMYCLVALGGRARD